MYTCDIIDSVRLFLSHTVIYYDLFSKSHAIVQKGPAIHYIV